MAGWIVHEFPPGRGGRGLGWPHGAVAPQSERARHAVRRFPRHAMSAIRLDDKVAVVTGASRGLGRAMAEALVEAGARVLLASPETQLLERAESEIEQRHGPGRALALTTDITRRADCERVLAEARRRFGALHVLVNNARRPHRGPGLPVHGNSLPFWE